MFFLGLQVAQGVHLLEDRLKKASEEVGGEKALRQVLETTFKRRIERSSKLRKSWPLLRGHELF